MQLNSFITFLKTLEKDNDLFRVKTVEMDLKGMLNPTNVLDELFFKEQKWLGFDEFYLYYVQKFSEQLMRKFNPKNIENFRLGLKARLYRTQFGFLTEYQAYLLAQEIFGKQNVFRDINLDKKGVDFQIMYNNIKYNIHIFVDTSRSWYYRNFKSANKHVDSVEGIHVNLPYALETGKFNSLEYLPNGFGIYTKEYFEYLKKEIDSGNLKKIIGTKESGFIYSESLSPT
ncbi:TaqI family restriction endonuclease [Candidatus Woesearchaeota archaeon]|nr:TaqI family restriction endonuclease [Candidatus Woesearchaeota archaeon]